MGSTASQEVLFENDDKVSEEGGNVKQSPQKKVNSSILGFPLLHADFKVEKEIHSKEFLGGTVAKIMLVGDAGVGKTSLSNRYMKSQFPEQHRPTIGMDFTSKTVELANNAFVNVQVSDTAGDDRFRAIIQAYFKSANAVALVYDISAPQSLQGLVSWVDLIHKHAPENVLMMVIGNKCDLRESRDPTLLVKQTEIEQLVSQFPKAQFVECSAQTGANVENSFNLLVSHCMQQKESPELYQ